MSIQSGIAKLLLKYKIVGWQDGSIPEQRAKQEKVTSYARLPKGVDCKPVLIQEICGEWLEGPHAGQGVILYLHGGAYILGSVRTHREFAARIAFASEAKVLTINYRLAPEHPYPAALEDVVSAYEWLLQENYSPHQIIMAGDSAGGGLLLAAMLRLRDMSKPLPAGGVCFSPWTDLALTGDSYRSKAAVDAMLNLERIKNCAKLYAAEHDRKDPLISPLYGDLQGLPPLLIQVGTEELLLDDAVRFAERSREAGLDVSLEVWQGMFHVFQIFPFLPETKKALDSVARFVGRRFS